MCSRSSCSSLGIVWLGILLSWDLFDQHWPTTTAPLAVFVALELDTTTQNGLLPNVRQITSDGFKTNLQTVTKEVGPDVCHETFQGLSVVLCVQLLHCCILLPTFPKHVPHRIFQAKIPSRRPGFCGKNTPVTYSNRRIGPDTLDNKNEKMPYHFKSSWTLPLPPKKKCQLESKTDP